MSDYDYGNARLRAMKSKLLSRHGLDPLIRNQLNPR
jgi:vacuolar-type H+-ATPase subunit C/Vma6